jgi:transposase
MFEDEARFGRMIEPRRAWTPPGLRPLVATRIEREYGYAYAAVSPHDGALASLVLPEVNAEFMSLFLAEVAGRYRNEFILMVLDGAGWHRANDLVVPANMRLEPLPARSPELNPAEHLWEELREKWLGNRLYQPGGRRAPGHASFGGAGARCPASRLPGRLRLDLPYPTQSCLNSYLFDRNFV